jgi:hypothetical protein
MIALDRSTVLLLEVLASEDVRGKPLAVVLNKSDLVIDGKDGISSFEDAMRLDDLLEERNMQELRRHGSVMKDFHTVKLVGSSLGCELARFLRDWISAFFVSL